MTDVTSAARGLFTAAPATRSLESARIEGSKLFMRWADAFVTVDIPQGDDMAPVNAILEACRQYDATR